MKVCKHFKVECLYLIFWVTFTLDILIYSIQPKDGYSMYTYIIAAITIATIIVITFTILGTIYNKIID